MLGRRSGGVLAPNYAASCYELEPSAPAAERAALEARVARAKQQSLQTGGFTTAEAVSSYPLTLMLENESTARPLVGRPKLVAG